MVLTPIILFGYFEQANHFALGALTSLQCNARIGSNDRNFFGPQYTRFGALYAPLAGAMSDVLWIREYTTETSHSVRMKNTIRLEK